MCVHALMRLGGGGEKERSSASAKSFMQPE